MFGPMFHLELLNSSRRYLFFLGRMACGCWFIVFIAMYYARMPMWLVFGPLPPPIPLQDIGTLQELFAIQFIFLSLLAVPLYCTSAITIEKRHGTLPYLLMTDLSSWEIVAGKIAARSLQVILVSWTSLPLLCLFGGLNPITVLVLAVVSALPVLALASVCILASVLCRTTAAAAALVYASWALAFWLLAQLDLLYFVDPVHVLEPIWEKHDFMMLMLRLAWWVFLWGSMALLAARLAAWRLRPQALRELSQESRRNTGRWRRWLPPVGDDPMRWKDHYLEGLAALTWLRRLPSWLLVACIAASALLSSLAILWFHLPNDLTADELRLANLPALLARLNDAGPAFAIQSLLAISFASLMVGVRCAEAVAGERERQTWDLLLLTGMDPRVMLRSKCRGIVESSYPFLAAYAVPTLLCAMLGGPVAFLCTFLLVGVAWPVMYFLGAIALERSTLHASTRWSIPHGLLSGFMMLGLVLYPFAYGGLLVVMNFAGPGRNTANWVDSVGTFLGGLAIVLAVGVVFGAILVRIASNFVRDAAVNLLRQQKGLDKEVVR